MRIVHNRIETGGEGGRRGRGTVRTVHSGVRTGGEEEGEEEGQ